MATRQIIPQRYTGGLTGVNQYINPLGETWDSTNIPARICYQMKLKQISISLSVAPAGAATWTFNVLKNGSTCGMQIVITNSITAATATGNVTFNENDTITLQRVPTSNPTASTVTSVTWVWDNQNARQCSYPMVSATSGVATGGGIPGWVIGSATSSVQIPFAVSGVITKIKVNLNLGPGSGGDSYTWVIFKNEVEQNGAGGTTDTQVAIVDAATSGEWNGSLSVTAGDRITFLVRPANAPTNAGTYAISFGFEPTVDGYSQLIGGLFSNMPGVAATNYAPIHRIPGTSWNASETDQVVQILGPNISFIATALYARMSGTASTNQTFNTRKNSGATAQTCTILATAQNASDVANPVSFVTNDTLSLQLVGAGNAGTARRGNVALAIFALAAGGGAGAGKGNKGNKGGGGINIQTPGSPVILGFNSAVDISTS